LTVLIVLSTHRYTEEFAMSLASRLHSLCTPSTNIAFVCCPTGFVAFQRTKPIAGATLLEYDQRFAVLSPKQFVPYDLDEPDVFPDSLKENFDIVVVDPPFLNEVTNRKLTQTLSQILKPEGKLVIITSTSVEDIICRLYDEPPLGRLRRTAINVEHGRLANDFACWGSWEGAEDFGQD
ncbi:putative N6-adenine methyltransferase-domain-containing protein, partial [Gymnopilus junonius]